MSSLTSKTYYLSVKYGIELIFCERCSCYLSKSLCDDLRKQAKFAVKDRLVLWKNIVHIRCKGCQGGQKVDF